MVALIPPLSEIGAGIGYVANNACDMASSAVQQWVTSPSIAQAGLQALSSQIDALEQLVVKLRIVADGVEQVHGKLVATHHIEWHSPAGQAFREAVNLGQSRAQELENTARQTVRLAQASLEELRTLIAGLQTLLATARAAVGDSVAGALGQVCA